MKKMVRYILNTSRLYVLLSGLFQSIPLELIQNNKISSLTQTSTFKKVSKITSPSGISANIRQQLWEESTIILARLEHKLLKQK